jgi:hypothetical protein
MPRNFFRSTGLTLVALLLAGPSPFVHPTPSRHTSFKTAKGPGGGDGGDPTPCGDLCVPLRYS